MSSRRNSAVAANTAKARKYDIQERLYVQSRGDAADLQRGRTMAFYDDMNTYAEDRQAWVYRHMLTPCEEWAVRQGYCEHPFADRPKPVARTGRMFPVYYSDGARRMCRSLEEARRHLNDEGAVRLFNGTGYEYAVSCMEGRRSHVHSLL